MPKNPVLAAFLSFLVPGMGQIYSGKILFGVGLIILSFIVSTLTIVLTIFGIMNICNNMVICHI